MFLAAAAATVALGACGGLAVAVAGSVVAVGAGFCHIDIRQPPLPNPFPYA